MGGDAEGDVPDGSPVDVYLALPVEPEFTPVLEHLPPGASVLDLGCGVGRLANYLAERGHDVTGVDESRAMLAHLTPAVTPINGRVEELDLGRRFDAVVLASHFVSHPDPARRLDLLRSTTEHVTADGVVYIEHYDTARMPADHDGHVGPVRVSLRILHRDGTRFRATVDYELDGKSWQQTFEAELLDDEALDRGLTRADLRFASRLSTPGSRQRRPETSRSSTPRLG